MKINSIFSNSYNSITDFLPSYLLIFMKLYSRSVFILFFLKICKVFLHNYQSILE